MKATLVLRHRWLCNLYAENENSISFITSGISLFLPHSAGNNLSYLIIISILITWSGEF